VLAVAGALNGDLIDQRAIAVNLARQPELDHDPLVVADRSLPARAARNAADECGAGEMVLVDAPSPGDTSQRMS
jgi:hypothetical protein